MLAKKIDHRPQSVVCLQASSLFENYGGIEYYLDDLLILMAEQFGEGAVRTVVPQRTVSPRLLERPYQVHFVPYFKNRILQKLENRLSLKMYRSALRLIAKTQPEFLLCGHVSLAPVAWAIRRATQIPYVTIAYGVECWGDLWWQDEWALKQSKKIFSISHWTQQVMEKRGYPTEQFAIIQPQLPTPFHNILPITRKAERAFTLLTVSRLDASEQYKGQDHVLFALGKILTKPHPPRIKYIIQGDGDDRQRLEALADALGLRSIVEFRGKVNDRTEIQKAYIQADLFVMPSRFGRWGRRWRGEGFGIVYLEAAAFGLPSVAYNCGGVTDIIEHGVNGMLVPSDNVSELARVILLMARDRTWTRQLGESARETVGKKFGKPAIAKQLQVALNSLIDTKTKQVAS